MLTRSGNLRTIRTGRRWRPNPIQAVLATGFLAFLGVALVILIQNIHLVPHKLTLRKDAAELARLERESRTDAAYGKGGSPPSPATAKPAIDLVDSQPEEHPPSDPVKPTLLASRTTSSDQKSNTHLEGTRRLRVLKRDLEGRPDGQRNIQRQRTVTPTRQRYEQRGLSSFFAGIGRALGF
jgi:hypothetical protein